MGTFIADLVLQILSLWHKVNVKISRNVRLKGIAAAKAKGIHMGRPVKGVPENFGDLVTIGKDTPIGTGPAGVWNVRSDVLSKTSRIPID